MRFDGLVRADIDAIAAMTDVMSHRGPDDRGIFVSSRTPCLVALGHRRLSILDLSKAGHQPMADPSGRYWIVFNGEIYNFPMLRVSLADRGWEFFSMCDTEVLLYLYIEYGPTCLNMIEGMFSFVVWDEEDKILFLARDRVGEKPLFYMHDTRKVLFASEIKSLLQHFEVNAESNREMVYDYLMLRYVPGPATLFRNIYKLPPASYAIVSRGEMNIRSYWDVQPLLPSRRRMRMTSAEPKFAEKFKSSVEKMLLADVPIGAFLSGGIDSSAVVSVMNELVGERIKTYSVGFDAPWMSELGYAKTVAQLFSTDHHEIMIDHVDYYENLAQLIWCRDLPVSEPADVPMISR